MPSFIKPVIIFSFLKTHLAGQLLFRLTVLLPRDRKAPISRALIGQ